MSISPSNLNHTISQLHELAGAEQEEAPELTAQQGSERTRANLGGHRFVATSGETAAASMQAQAEAQQDAAASASTAQQTAAYFAQFGVRG